MGNPRVLGELRLLPSSILVRGGDGSFQVVSLTYKSGVTVPILEVRVSLKFKQFTNREDICSFAWG